MPGDVRQRDVRVVPGPAVPVAAAQPGSRDRDDRAVRRADRIGQVAHLRKRPELGVSTARTRPTYVPTYFRGESARTAVAALRPLVAITLPAGMGGRAAQVDARDRRARREPVLPHLVGRHLALEDVAAGQADPLLDVGRAEHLVVLEAVLEVRARSGRSGR